MDGRFQAQSIDERILILHELQCIAGRHLFQCFSFIRWQRNRSVGMRITTNRVFGTPFIGGNQMMQQFWYLVTLMY